MKLGEAENICSHRVFRTLTQVRHRPVVVFRIQRMMVISI